MNPQFQVKQRVNVCDCRLIGRVSAVFTPPALTPSPRHESESDGERAGVRCQPSPFYYRIAFPIPSPFIDNWAVYRQNELALFVEQPKLINLNVVNAMRPKVPTS